MRKPNYVAPGQKWTASHTCPICGRTGMGATPHCHGFEADNGFVYCTSDEHANGALYKDQMVPPAYLHKREQDGSYRPWTATPPPTPISAARRAHAAAPPKAHTSEPGTRYFTYTDTQRVRRTDAPGKEKIILPEHLINGQWHTGEGSGEIEYIYRRAETAEHPNQPLDIFEGETCAEAGAALGLRAMTWRGGTGRVNKAIEQIIAICTDQDVVLHKDSDQPGRKAMHQIAVAIAPVAASVKILDYYPDENPERGGKDIEDWMSQGGDADALGRLIADAQDYEPDATAGSARLGARRVLLGARMVDGVAPPDHLIPGVLLRGGVHILAGEPESGKTIIALWMAIKTMEQGLPVLYFDEESGPDMLTERLEAMGVQPALLDALFHYVPFAGFGIAAEDIAEIIDYINVVRPALIVADSLADWLQAAGIDENNALEVTGFMKAWPVPAARQFNSTVVLIDHTVKATENNGYSRGSGAKKSKADAMWFAVKSAEFSRDKLGTVELKRKKNRLGTLLASVRFTVGGHQGALICAEQSGTWESPKTLSEGTTAILQALSGFPKEGARFAEWFRQTSVPETTFRRHIGELKNAECLRHIEQRYSLTDTGRATLSAAFGSTATTAKQPPMAAHGGSSGASGDEEESGVI